MNRTNDIAHGKPGGPASRAERYARWVIRNRWWVLAVAFVATVGAGTGVSKLGLATDYRVFFSEDNPDLEAYEAVENIYTKNDNVLLVIRPNEGDVFTPRVLEAVRSLTEAAWQIPHGTRVDGITNFQHTWANGDELIVEDLVGDGPITPAVIARAREVSLAEPLLVGRMIAPDGRTTGINVRISLPGESQAELPATGEYVRGLLDDYRARYPDLEIHAAGIAMMNLAFAETPMKDMPVVMPLMFGVLTLAIVLFLRSFSGVAATFAVIIFSTLTAVGVAGHLGILRDLAEHHRDSGGGCRPHTLRPVGRQPLTSQVVLPFNACDTVFTGERNVHTKRTLVDVDLIIDVEPVGQGQLVQQHVLRGQSPVIGQPVLLRFVGVHIHVEALHRSGEAVDMNDIGSRFQIVYKAIDRPQELGVADLL